MASNWKQASGNEPEGDVNEDGQKAKARLVIGFEDPGIGQVCQDAPTLSKDGRSVVLQMVGSRRWGLITFDVSISAWKRRWTFAWPPSHCGNAGNAANGS